MKTRGFLDAAVIKSLVVTPSAPETHGPSGGSELDEAGALFGLEPTGDLGPMRFHAGYGRKGVGGGAVRKLRNGRSLRLGRDLWSRLSC